MREPPRTVAIAVDSRALGEITVVQTVMRFAFTVAALVGLSALFASQIQATLQ